MKKIAITGSLSSGKTTASKILAAKRANIKEIILCDQNKADVEEIKKEYVRGLKFHYVSKMSEVIDIAITNYNVDNFKTL